MRRPTLLGFACSEHCQPDMRPHVQPDHFPPCGCGSSGLEPDGGPPARHHDDHGA